MAKSKESAKTSSNDEVTTISIDLQAIAGPIALVLSVLIFSIGFVAGLSNINVNVAGAGAEIDSDLLAEVIDNFDSGGDQPSPSPSPSPEPSPTPSVPQGNQQATVSIDDDPYLGNRDSAQVAIVEFSDFNCPFCQRHHQQTQPQIISNYIETGEAILVYRDYAGVGGEATRSAGAAAECVREQTDNETYFSVVQQMYDSNVRGKDADLVVEIAENIGGIDIGSLNECIESERFISEVEDDTSDGQNAGINGTPGFVVGVLQGDGTVDGEIVSGALPYAAFEQAIANQLDRI